MEDFIARGQFNGFSAFAVFDGHGGKGVAQQCSEQFSDILQSFNISHSSYSDEMFKVFMSLDGLVRRKAEFNQMGATATVVIVSKDTIITGNCGDSGAIMGSLSTFKELTKNHKVQDETERLRKLGAIITHYPNDTPRINGALNLARSIGDVYLTPYVVPNPFVSIVSRTPNVRYVVLASDGLWDTVNTDYVHRYISGMLRHKDVVQTDIESMLRHLMLSAQSGGSTDNISIVIIIL